RQSDRYRSLSAQGKKENEILQLFREPVEMELWSWSGTDTVQISPLDSVKHYLSFLQAGFTVMEAKSGHILAWVGGGNF
ncbi:MAG: penicillin-binding protein, partial [Bacteroidota bacterium]